MARYDDEPQPTAVPSSPPSPEPVDPSVEIFMPNLNRVSSATFRRGTLGRRRVNIALGLLLAIAVLTTTLALFADTIFASLGTVLACAFVVALAVGIGVVLIRRDEQRARRAARRDNN